MIRKREALRKRAQLDKQAVLLKRTDPDRLRSILEKSETVQIRVTASDKASLTETASALGLTVTDYLTRLHLFAVEVLAKSSKGGR